MPATIQQLMHRMAQEPFCAVHARTQPLRLAAGVQLPPDVAAFYHAFAGGDIFTARGGDGLMLYQADTPANGWELDPQPFEHNANYLSGEGLNVRSSLIPYHDHCYVLGRDTATSSTHLCIDLHPEQFGWIFLNLGRAYEDFVGFETPVVAKSFTEWLERTLDFGPLFDPDDEGLEVDAYHQEADDGYPECVVPPDIVKEHIEAARRGEAPCPSTTRPS